MKSHTTVCVGVIRRNQHMCSVSLVCPQIKGSPKNRGVGVYKTVGSSGGGMATVIPIIVVFRPLIVLWASGVTIDSNSDAVNVFTLPWLPNTVR